MDEQKLAKLLEELQAELAHTDSVDEKGQELLRHLETDLHALLERSAVRASAAQRLEDAISHLELTHPTLTMTLAKMLEALSNVGI
jgi:hypothetical protein